MLLSTTTDQVSRALVVAFYHIIKSKSFANPGQFECSIEESAGKKLQMLSFFSNSSNSSNTSQKPVVEKPRAASICDEMDDEDLVDIDAEFESLLTKTFEKESRKLSIGKKRKGWSSFA